MKTYRSLSFAFFLVALLVGSSTLLGDLERRVTDGYRVEAEALRKAVAVFGATADEKFPQELAMVSGGPYQSGFYRMDQNWSSERVRQFEFTVRSDKPGYFRLAGNLEKAGVRTQFKCVSSSVIPDGVYRTIVFVPPNDVAWEGTITNWELAWLGDEGASIGLKLVDANEEPNQFLDAVHATPEAPLPAPVLRPRAKCRLSWQDGSCPGMVLQFLDFRMKELPGSAIRLPKGGGAVNFVTPAEMVLAVARLDEAGEGYPLLEQLEYRPMFETQGKWRGSWLWFRKEEGPDNYNVWFEREFDLDSAPEYGSIAFMADDVAYIYVNGTYCGKNEVWPVPARCNITHALRAGKNRIQVRVFNGGQAAGFVADLYLQTATQELFLDTDDQWRCESKSNEPHRLPTAVEEPVVVLGNPHVTAPWKGGIGYRYAGPRGELEVRALSEGAIEAVVKKLPPFETGEFNFVLSEKGGVVRNYSLPIAPDSSQWRVGQTVTLRYRLPEVDAGEYSVRIDDDFVGLVGDPEIAHKKVLPREQPQPQQARFTGIGDHPQILLGDRTITPFFWHSIMIGKSKRFHEIPCAERCGTNNFRIHAAFKDFWKAEGEYDFARLDEVVDAVFAAQPDAVLALHVYAEMPIWWLEANPGETHMFMDGTTGVADRFKQSLASRKWLVDAEAPLRAVIEHLKRGTHADRVWGISIAEDQNGEWFWDMNDMTGKRNWAGYNQTDLRNFRDFLRAKYGTDAALAAAWHREGATIDGVDRLPEWRRAQEGTLGELLDPAKDQELMDWLEARNLALGHAIAHFARIAKEATDGKWLVGAYYGYLTELLANESRSLLLTGHNGIREVLECGDVDFLSAPSRYGYRMTGESDGIMQPWTTLARHGIVTYNEMDYRTAYNKVPEPEGMRLYVGQPSTAYETVGQLNRSLGMNLATGIAGYWYDLRGGEFYEHGVTDLMREQLRFYETLPPTAGTTPVQVVVVGDVDSSYYAKAQDGHSALLNAIEGTFSQLSRLGAPYESLLVDDLLDTKKPLPPHRLYIMLPTLVLSDAQRQALKARFEAERAAVLWLYAAGPFRPGESASAAANADFLGIRTVLRRGKTTPVAFTIPEYGAVMCSSRAETAPWFLPVDGYEEVVAADVAGTPWLVRKKIGRAEHFYSAMTDLPAAFYDELYIHLGVQRYTTGLEDQVWVGNDMLFLYAVSGGTKQLNIPKGYRAVPLQGPFPTGVEVKANGRFRALPGLTYGFRIEKLPETNGLPVR